MHHYHLDHLGTPQEVTNDTGEIVWRARLRVWGGVARTLNAAIAQPIRFQGQYHDAESGLYYNRYRYYAPDEGCYVQQDPIGLAGGINTASYVGAPTGWGNTFEQTATIRAPQETTYYEGIAACQTGGGGTTIVPGGGGQIFIPNVPADWAQ